MVFLFVFGLALVLLLTYIALEWKSYDQKKEWDISFERCLSQGQEIEIYITIEDLEEAEIAGSGIIIGMLLFPHKLSILNPKSFIHIQYEPKQAKNPENPIHPQH